jgi:hypothetical protein
MSKSNLNLKAIGHGVRKAWEDAQHSVDKAIENKHVMFMQQVHKLIPASRVLTTAEVKGIMDNAWTNKETTATARKTKANAKLLVEVHEQFSSINTLCNKVLSVSIGSGLKGSDVIGATDLRLFIARLTRNHADHKLPNESTLVAELKLKADKGHGKSKNVSPRKRAIKSSSDNVLSQYLYDDMYELSQAKAIAKMNPDVKTAFERLMDTLWNSYDIKGYE